MFNGRALYKFRRAGVAVDDRGYLILTGRRIRSRFAVVARYMNSLV